MRCLNCGKDNPPEARFCASCGADLEVAVEQPSSMASVRCNNCGQDNPPKADFCSNCGTNLVVTSAPPSAGEATRPSPISLKWFLIGGLAILIMFQIIYSLTLLIKTSPPIPAPPSMPVPQPTLVPTPPIPPPALEETTPVIIKGEALFFEDFESGSQNWDLAGGWHLEKIGDNTILKGRGHSWAVLQDRLWDDYAFEAEFKLIEGSIHFNYRTTSDENIRYLVGVSHGSIYLEKEIEGKHYKITQAPLDLDEGWHEIEIIGYGNTIHVYLDDSLLIVSKDNNPLLSGGIAFLTLVDSEFLIDDVKITETLPPVIYVDSKYKGSGVGTSERPLNTIQEGINRGDGTIRVAAGTYYESINLKDNIVLLGGAPDRTVIYGDVMAQNVTGAEIRGFTITDNSTAGIHCYFSSVTIANNIIINQPDCGIGGHDNSLTIINNVIAGNGASGIGLGENSELTIRNNIIFNNAHNGINVSEPIVSCFVDYNLMWNNLEGDYGYGVLPGPHNIYANPLFVDADGGNFQLQPSSPCINTGDPTPQYNDEDGSRNDVGAFGGWVATPPIMTIPPKVTAPSTEATARVLVDASRDGGAWWFPQAPPVNPEQGHQGKALADYLGTLGYEVSELPPSYTINKDLLEQYDVVIRANEYTQYNTEEIDAYKTYVRNGGKLLLLADYMGAGETDSLATSFGLIFAGTTRGQGSTISEFSDHPITIGAPSIHYIVGSGLISYPQEAQIIGWLSQNMYLDLNNNGVKDTEEPTGPPVLGCMNYGDGKIVFLGDTNALQSVPQPITKNIMDWFEQ